MHYNVGGNPGMQASVFTQENQIWWGHENLRIYDPLAILASTAIDAGNAPTSQLRSGLVLAKLDASGKYAEYDPTQTDGREVARGVLQGSLSMLNGMTGLAEDKNQGAFEVMIGGLLKNSALFGLDGGARLQLGTRFVFDDEIQGRNWGGGGLWLREVAKAANYVVVAGDNLTEFRATAAVQFTLPAIAKGLRFKFRQEANAGLIIAAPAAILIGVNGVAFTTLTFNTAAQMIGAGAIVYANAAGTKWIVEYGGAPGTTVTATWA